MANYSFAQVVNVTSSIMRPHQTYTRKIAVAANALT